MQHYTDADAEGRSAVQDRAENAETDALTPPPHKVDPSIDADSRRPLLPLHSDPLQSDALHTPPSNASDFTSEELDLLGSKASFVSLAREFIHRILEKNGFTSEGVIRRESAGE